MKATGKVTRSPDEMGLLFQMDNVFVLCKWLKYVLLEI